MGAEFENITLVDHQRIIDLGGDLRVVGRVVGKPSLWVLPPSLPGPMVMIHQVS